MRVRVLLLGYLLIAVFATWPIASVVIASTIASWNGCTLHEGFVNPCVVGGRDIGGTLYSMGVMGWFMIATLPMGVILFVLWTAGWFIWRAIQKKRAAAPAAAASGSGRDR